MTCFFYDSLNQALEVWTGVVQNYKVVFGTHCYMLRDCRMNMRAWPLDSGVI